MKIYIAGKWHNKEQIRGYMDELESIGHEITHDWTSYESDPNNSFQDMADHDIEGVMKADALIAIMDDDKYPYRGTFTELGVAFATKKTINKNYKIFIVCPSYPYKNEDKKPYYSTNCFFKASAINGYFTKWEYLPKVVLRPKN